MLQAQSQLNAIYKDSADTIDGNMDTSIFLGGKEPTTLKELAAVLGKETIDTYNTGESRGRETSHSVSYTHLDVYKRQHRNDRADGTHLFSVRSPASRPAHGDYSHLSLIHI